MCPGEKVANRPHRDAAILPFVSEHAKRGGKKRIVTELIDTNFRANNRQCHHVAEPGRFTSIQTIDKGAMKSPDRNRKQQVAKVPRVWASALKQENQKDFCNERTGGREHC